MLELQQRLPHDLPLALLVEVDLLERPLADLARPLNLRETKLEEQNTTEKKRFVWGRVGVRHMGGMGVYGGGGGGTNKQKVICGIKVGVRRMGGMELTGGGAKDR